MTTTTPPLTEVTTGDRAGRLTAQIRALRTRAVTAERDRWLLVAGGILMPLGIVLIILGWAGAAGTPLPFEQTDYLISGGILGLALVIAGGFVYFAYWQTIRVRESREQARELSDAVRLLTTQLVGTTADPAGAPSGQLFVATAKGSIFHRRDCPIVIGRDDVTPVNPERTNLRPCRICEPLADGA